jgi:hypothetical protein
MMEILDNQTNKQFRYVGARYLTSNSKSLHRLPLIACFDVALMLPLNLQGLPAVN